MTKIGIDARPLQGDSQYRGIGKALEALLKALKYCLSSEDIIYFYIDEGLPVPEVVKEFPGGHIKSVRTSRLGRTHYIRSFLPPFRLIKPHAKDIDVLLQYDVSCGVPQNVATVTVFHDLIPYLFHDQEIIQPVKGMRRFKNNLAREMYWKKYLGSLKLYRNSKRIIAISKASKTDLLHYLPSLSSKSINIIYHGADNVLSAKTLASTNVKKLALRPYLLFVGGIDLRKNIMGLLTTFYELKPHYPQLQLVLVGKEFELTDQMADLGWFDILNSTPAFAKDVLTPGFVSPGDLAYLYRHAQAFVFASRYEGFGLPVLEAMQAGCPVVAYNNSSIPEIAGDAALLVPDGQSLVPALMRLLDSENLRKELTKRGEWQAKNFTWEETAKKTLAILKEVGSNSV
jgi:glycosyltransferase involved in cell wall biosynthesis